MAFLHSYSSRNLYKEVLRGADHNVTGLKTLAFTISKIPHMNFLKMHIFA